MPTFGSAILLSILPYYELYRTCYVIMIFLRSSGSPCSYHVTEIYQCLLLTFSKPNRGTLDGSTMWGASTQWHSSTDSCQPMTALHVGKTWHDWEKWRGLKRSRPESLSNWVVSESRETNQSRIHQMWFKTASIKRSVRSWSGAAQLGVLNLDTYWDRMSL